MTVYRRWLLAQLKFVETIDKHPEPQSHHFDELRNLITEAGQRASVAGLPIAVQACETRQGPISPDIARKILATCLATTKTDIKTNLSRPVPAVAKLLQVSPEKVRRWIKSGKLSATNVNKPGVRPSYRISDDDLREFQSRGKVMPSGLLLDVPRHYSA